MTELMKEIKDYWNTRTEGYSEVNEKELLGTQKEAWLMLLKNKFPQKARESLRILGYWYRPRFFSCDPGRRRLLCGCCGLHRRNVGKG